MKILEINKFHYPKGGADKNFLDLVKLFRQQSQDVAVFSMDNFKNSFSPWKRYFVSYVGYNQDDSTFWERVKGVFRMFYSLEAKQKIGELLHDFNPDLVHIHNIYHQISPSILPEIKKRGIPIVMSVHDYSLICPDYLMNCNGQDWEKMGEHRYFEFVKKKCFKNSYLKSLLAALVFVFHKKIQIYEKNIDLFLVPSNFTKDKLIQGGIDREKIVVLPHFIWENGTQEKIVGDTSEKYAFYFGRISRDKGVDRLIEVFLKNSGWKLYLAGALEDGFEIPQNERIKYLGFLEQEKLETYIRNSLFVISFSTLPETFGLIALEAMRNGKPFIGFDCGAYGEIVENDQTGYVVSNRKEAEEKIGKLWGDDGLRILFSRKALLRSEDFFSGKYYLKIMEIFCSLTRF